MSYRCDSSRPGSLRAIVARIATEPFDVIAVHGIDAGDALALATRFDAQWAYRGGQALLWHPPFKAHEVHDRYLPAPPLRPFERRGLLEVRGECNRAPIALVAAEFSSDRNEVRELRFLRTVLQHIESDTIVFLANAGAVTKRHGFNATRVVPSA